MDRVLIERFALRHWSVIAAVCFLGAISGCGSSGPTGKVEGRVTLGGAPAPEGAIVMFTEGPDPFSGIVGQDGKFTVDRPVKAGTYAVSVQQIEPEKSYEETKKGSGPAFQSVIPERYRLAGSSGVKFEVKSGEENKFELDMVAGATIQPGGGMPMKGRKG